jgi:2-dehydro-3-deoxy-D-arabinonate dehydratase
LGSKSKIFFSALPADSGPAEIWEWLSQTDPIGWILDKKKKTAATIVESEIEILPPGRRPGSWASGVTYLRSKVARMEESEQGGDFYDRVYDAERPELFFKSTAGRVVGCNQPIRVRRDSEWNVPEPELVLVISSRGKVVGYTIGNDVFVEIDRGRKSALFAAGKGL